VSDRPQSESGTTEFSLGNSCARSRRRGKDPLRRLRELGYVTCRQGYSYFVSHTPPGYV
jgi:hypothetical protein